jgi:hypothetical protein
LRVRPTDERCPRQSCQQHASGETYISHTVLSRSIAKRAPFAVGTTRLADSNRVAGAARSDDIAHRDFKKFATLGVRQGVRHVQSQSHAHSAAAARRSTARASIAVYKHRGIASR